MGAGAAIILAGGRSSRMGSPKAELDWHGSTLLRRVAGIVARGVEGPVIVVGAPDQRLPALPPRVEVVSDARAGRGPLEGLAAGLAAVNGRAAAAYVSSTDVPLLHPAFVRAVLAALDADADIALPVLAGHRQPLSAAYRVTLLDTVRELVDAGRLRPGLLFERCRVRTLPADALLRDPALRRADPRLDSVTNLNEPSDYLRARARSAPAIEVRWPGPPGSVQTVPAWTLGELAARVGVVAGGVLMLNGETAEEDPELALAAGDVVSFTNRGGAAMPASEPRGGG